MAISNQKIEKIKRFVNDPEMSKAVYQVLLKAFLKPQKDKDVQVLAASMLSVHNLDEAWRELLKFKNNDTKDASGPTNPGL